MANKVVLDVNGVQLTSSEFAQELAHRLKDHDALTAKDPNLVNMVKSKICEEFIVQTMADSWAKENGVVLKAEELESEIRSIQKTYPDDLSFQRALAETGTTFKEWRDRLQKTLVQKRVVAKLLVDIDPPSESELLTFYNENKPRFSVRESAQIRQVLVATESDAKIIETELKKGRKMSDIAKNYSISPEASLGGVVGWIERGLSDVFEPAFHMKVGSQGPAVKSTFGYHIFELMARKPSRTLSFKEAHDDVTRIFMEKKEQALYLAWLEQQTRKARVYKDQAFIDALTVETKAR